MGNFLFQYTAYALYLALTHTGKCKNTVGNLRDPRPPDLRFTFISGTLIFCRLTGQQETLPPPSPKKKTSY